MGKDADREDPERQSDRDQVDPTADAERRQDEADERDHIEDEGDHAGIARFGSRLAVFLTGSAPPGLRFGPPAGDSPAGR